VAGIEVEEGTTIDEVDMVDHLGDSGRVVPHCGGGHRTMGGSGLRVIRGRPRHGGREAIRGV